jgi:hypothetical protein
VIPLTVWQPDLPDRPWLVLGKGPTFSHHVEVDLSQYNTVGLNHVAAEVPVHVAHVIDLDVVEACGDAILRHAEWLVMPLRPHVQNRPSELLLRDFLPHLPTLQEMERRGRLVAYNIESSPVPGGGPVVEVKYFSSEAVFSILGLLGAHTVRSLGIDGGRGYSSAFASLERRTMLNNDKPSFDVQFVEIERICRRHGMDYHPLVEPIRVFVGVDRSQLVAAKVLEESIRSRTRRQVQFIPMLDVPTPLPKHRENRPRTAFSFSRFLIPQLAGCRGRAIYLDADMQVFADIEELWNADMAGKSVLVTRQDEPPEKWKGSSWFRAGPQMSVMLLDCDRLSWDIEDIISGLDEGRYTYQQLMFELCIVPDEQLGTHLPAEWNHLEHFEPDGTKLLHYTVVQTQPWKSDENPLGGIWMDGFRDAVRSGALSVSLVEELAAEGHVKPSFVGEARELSPEAADQLRPRSVHELELAAVRDRLDDVEASQFKLLRARWNRGRKDLAYVWRSWRRRELAQRLSRIR